MQYGYIKIESVHPVTIAVVRGPKVTAVAWMMPDATYKVDVQAHTDGWTSQSGPYRTAKRAAAEAAKRAFAYGVEVK